MGERKGQNKYYPPDFDWKVHPSLNAYHGTHALRERARKLHQGILIIRFEMPFNIWCEGCKNHIGMGVRYNAEKSKVGMYYTTPLWRFRMKCHLCDNHFEIDTDPKNFTYVIRSGARREELRWDAKDNEQIVNEAESEKELMATNPMYKLQHSRKDEAVGASLGCDLEKVERSRLRWKDDYGLNCELRRMFRGEKVAIERQECEDRTLRSNPSIQLLRASRGDSQMASEIFSASSKQSANVASSAMKPPLSRPVVESPCLFGESPLMPKRKGTVTRVPKRAVVIRHPTKRQPITESCSEPGVKITKLVSYDSNGSSEE